ncbi:hypothetical protein FisN_2Hh583 [Fistulifera solaris]|uniref:Methyltransferase domain-containing protein n=1 Tax=Fistulifera solaris TaxID=1519565 RepID=A0A1Z5JGE9_FISSO|nr:hypothetical protein FisN_2Hh583 [Fistulifera solaris]|eukprot:GAX13074.1 hypothetical protein FisN_2Hh583 [Fistulifera solaris]
MSNMNRHQAFFFVLGLFAASNQAYVLTTPKKCVTSLQATVGKGESIYSLPALYDLAFGYRDFEEEVDFLLNTHERLAGRPALSVLELAAGPARHALTALSDTSIQTATAVDSSKEMADYAKEIALEMLDEQQLKSFQYCVDDMRSFRYKNGKDSVDTVWILLGSLQHLTSNDDVISCLQAVREALSEDGTVVLELPHPRETFSMVECTKNSWKVPLEDDSGNESGELKIIWGDDGDTFDPIQQVRQFTVAMELMGVAQSEGIQNIRQVVPLRLFTAQEIGALARCAGLELVEMHGALEEGVQVDDEMLAFRLVCVLQHQKNPKF